MPHHQVDMRDLNGFSTHAKQLVALCNLLEWSTTFGGKNNTLIRARSADGSFDFNIPATSINENRRISMLRKVTRHTPMSTLLRKISLDADLRSMSENEQRLHTMLTLEIVEWVRRDMEEGRLEDDAALTETVAEAFEPRPRPHARRKRFVPDDAPTPMTAEAQMANDPGPIEFEDPDRTRDLAGERVVQRVGRVKAVLGDAAQRDLRARAVGLTLIASRPWLVRRGGHSGSAGRMYESGRVLVDTYDNGLVMYRCVGCGWLALAPRSVGAHARVHPELPSGVDEVFTVSEYEPTELRQQAQKRLERELLAALQSLGDSGEFDDPELLVKALAEQVIANRATDREDDGPPEPLTDEQIVKRITRLVDRGRMAELTSTVQDLTDRIVTMTAEVESERTRRERVESNLDAAADLLAELRGEK